MWLQTPLFLWRFGSSVSLAVSFHLFPTQEVCNLLWSIILVWGNNIPRPVDKKVRQMSSNSLMNLLAFLKAECVVLGLDPSLGSPKRMRWCSGLAGAKQSANNPGPKVQAGALLLIVKVKEAWASEAKESLRSRAEDVALGHEFNSRYKTNKQQQKKTKQNKTSVQRPGGI